MTELERREFERQKESAIKQFNDTYKPKPQTPSPPKTQKDDIKKVKPKESFGLSFLRLLNFNEINLDTDKLIILALILLLSTEKTNELLILALIYILF